MNKYQVYIYDDEDNDITSYHLVKGFGTLLEAVNFCKNTSQYETNLYFVDVEIDGERTMIGNSWDGDYYAKLTVK